MPPDPWQALRTSRDNERPGRLAPGVYLGGQRAEGSDGGCSRLLLPVYRHVDAGSRQKVSHNTVQACLYLLAHGEGAVPRC